MPALARALLECATSRPLETRCGGRAPAGTRCTRVLVAGRPLDRSSRVFKKLKRVDPRAAESGAWRSCPAGSGRQGGMTEPARADHVISDQLPLGPPRSIPGGGRRAGIVTTRGRDAPLDAPLAELACPTAERFLLARGRPATTAGAELAAIRIGSGGRQIAGGELLLRQPERRGRTTRTCYLFFRAGQRVTLGGRPFDAWFAPTSPGEAFPWGRRRRCGIRSGRGRQNFSFRARAPVPSGSRGHGTLGRPGAACVDPLAPAARSGTRVRAAITSSLRLVGGRPRRRLLVAAGPNSDLALPTTCQRHAAPLG